MLGKLINFMFEAKGEMDKVSWPTREAVLGGTLAVFLISSLLVVFMWVMDFMVTQGLSVVFK